MIPIARIPKTAVPEVKEAVTPAAPAKPSPVTNGTIPGTVIQGLANAPAPVDVPQLPGINANPTTASRYIPTASALTGGSTAADAVAAERGGAMILNRAQQAGLAPDEMVRLKQILHSIPAWTAPIIQTPPGSIPSNALQTPETISPASRPHVSPHASPLGVSVSPIRGDVEKLGKDNKKRHDVDQLQLADRMVYDAWRIVSGLVSATWYGRPYPSRGAMALAKFEMAEASAIRRSVANSGVSPDLQEAILGADFEQQRGFDKFEKEEDGGDEMYEGFKTFESVESEILKS